MHAGAILVGVAIVAFYAFTWATYLADLSCVNEVDGRGRPSVDLWRALVAVSPIALAVMTAWFGVRWRLHKRPRAVEWIVWGATVLGSLTETVFVLFGLVFPHGVAP